MSTKHVLWAAGLDGPAAYSIDGGNSWVSVSTESITPTVWSVDAWSPKNALKVYSQFDEFEGIWYYSSGTWNPEFPAFDTLVFSRNPQRSALWCAEDDSLVVAINWAWIRQRLGPPGTPWTEQDYSPVYGTNQFWDVHGLPDGSAVYTAATEDTAAPTLDVHLLKLAGGVWTTAVIKTLTPPETMTISHIRAVSETEVWLAGYYYLGGPFDPYFYKIWKWDGAVLTEEWCSASNEGRLDGFPAFHMAEDGSEGWAVLRVWPASRMKYLRFDGEAWSSSASVDYGVEPQSITQIDGDTSSARLLLSDNTVVAYDGAVWSPLATAPPLGGSPLTLRYFQVPWVDPVTTYWANVKDGVITPEPSIHAYSIDGAVSFVSAGRPDIPDDDFTELVCGPKNSWKFYFLFGEGAGEGVWCYDSLGWRKELDVSVGTVLRGHAGIWCNEDDTYVAVGFYGGPASGGIHERVGPPGTPWTFALPKPYYGHAFMHGAPDGSAIFAIHDGASIELWRRNPASSVWEIVGTYGSSFVQSFFVVSDTEVWFTRFDFLTLQIVKWDGVGFNVEFSKTYGGVPGQTTVWGFCMAEDGSEGWAVVAVDYVPTNDFIHYDGANWSVVQSAPYSSGVAGVTQVDGVPSSAKIMLRDGSIREYDGATWDTTYSGTSLIPGMSASAYYTVRSFDLFAVGSPPYLANLDPADGETGVYPDTDIVLDVLDADGDLDAASVIIEVNDVVAWSGGVQQNGFTVVKEVRPNGFRYTVTPPAFLDPGTTVVAVYAEDTAA